jgi:hypothetical protein
VTVTSKSTSLPLSSLLGGEAWIVYIVNLHPRAHSRLGVPHGTPSAGRPCWHGRHGLFSAKPHDEIGEIHAMRNQPTSLELFSPPLAVTRVRRGVGPASRASQQILRGAPSHQVNVQARQHRHPGIALCIECMLYHIRRPRSIHPCPRRTRTSVRTSLLIRTGRRYKGTWRYISMGDHVQSNNAPPRRLWYDARSQPSYRTGMSGGPNRSIKSEKPGVPMRQFAPN